MKSAASRPARAVLEIDARIELIASVEALSGRNPCPQGEESAYLRRVRAALDSSHPACRQFSAMSPSDWRHRHPSLIMLDFGPPPALEVESQRAHYDGDGRDDAVLRLLPLLRDFAARGFMKFLAQERPFHERLLDGVREPFSRLDYDRPLREYLGLPLPHRYHFVMAPLYHGQGMHNLLVRGPKGPCDIYTICGHGEVKDDVPRLGLTVPEITQQAWHEVLHTVVDGLTKAHRCLFEPLSPLYALMTGRAQSEYRGPQGWLHMVDEQIIRATTSRLAAREFGPRAGEAALAREKASGFALVGVVHQALLEYERSREGYPTFAEFYPRLAAALSKIYPAAGGKGAAR